MPSTNVATSLHNRETAIGRAASYVRRKNAEDFAFIVVNGASTDCNTLVAASKSDGRARIILHMQPGPGGHFVRNRDAQDARADLNALLDDANECPPGFMRLSPNGP